MTKDVEPQLNKREKISDMLNKATHPKKVGIISAGGLSDQIVEAIQQNYLDLFVKKPFVTSFEPFDQFLKHTPTESKLKKEPSESTGLVYEKTAVTSGTDQPIEPKVTGEDDEYIFEPDPDLSTEDYRASEAKVIAEPQKLASEEPIIATKHLSFRERAQIILEELKRKLGFKKLHDKTESKPIYKPADLNASVAKPSKKEIQPTIDGIDEKMPESEIKERKPPSFIEIIKDKDILFIISCLDDENEIDTSFILSELAKDKEILTIVIASLPRYFGRVDNVHAMNKILHKLRLSAEIVIMIPYFETINFELIPNLIQELLELITEPGLINVDVADLRIIVTGGNVGVITFGTGRRITRAKDAFFEAIDSKLLNIDLPGVQKALLNVTGGKDMTLGEVEGIAEQIKRRLKPNARLILGARIDAVLKDEIKLFLLLGVPPMQVLVNRYATE